MDAYAHAGNRMPCYNSLVPRLLPAFQRCTRKVRESGKTYHVSDVVGGTLKSWEEPGYEATVIIH